MVRTPRAEASQRSSRVWFPATANLVELKKEGCCPLLEPLMTEAHERRFVFVSDSPRKRDKAGFISGRR
jgi:hypothetical protein